MSLVHVALTTLAGIVAGLGLWLWLWWRDRRRAWSEEELAAWVVAVGLVVRLLFVVLNPVYRAPDEHAHSLYVRYLGEHRALPVQTATTGDASKQWEYYQPPLYYALLAPVDGAAASLGLGEPARVRVLRLFSVLCWAGMVLAAKRLLDRIPLLDGPARTLVFALLAAIPTQAFLSAAVNNDNLLLCLGTVLLMLLLGRLGRGEVTAIGLLWGACLLTKLNAVVYGVAVVGVLAARAGSSRLSWAGALGRAAWIALLALLCVTPWLLWNERTYHALTGSAIANAPKHWSSTWQALLVTTAYLKKSFWAVTGEGNEHSFLPVIGVVLGDVAALGLAFGWLWRRQRMKDLLRPSARGPMAAFAAALAVNVLMVIGFGIRYGQGQGRFLYPMLAPLAVWMVLGWRAIALEKPGFRVSLHGIGLLVTYLLGYFAFSQAFAVADAPRAGVRSSIPPGVDPGGRPPYSAAFAPPIFTSEGKACS